MTPGSRRPTRSARGRRPQPSGGGGWLIPTAVRRDLAILGRSPERHLAEKITVALVGLIFRAGSRRPSYSSAAPTCRSSCPCGRRCSLPSSGSSHPTSASAPTPPGAAETFATPCASFLDLVVVALAGGSGVETALSGPRPGWARDGRSPTCAGPSTKPAWPARPPGPPSAELGQELGVGELSELAASVALAGTEGRQGPGLLWPQGGLAADPRAGRSRDRRSGRHRTHEPPRSSCSSPGSSSSSGYPAVEKVLTGL